MDDILTAEQEAEIWSLQDQMDEISKVMIDLNRRYDRAPDGSREKQRVVEKMEGANNRKVEIEQRMSDILG